MDISSSVLVVIDAQQGFVSDHSRHAVPVIARLVERWQQAGGAVVCTRYRNYPGSPYERIIGWTKMQGPPETDFVDELRPYLPAATVVDKTIYSLFTDQGAELVAQHGWTDLVICGLDTESCVLKTAVDAFERGLTPWVVTDASASHAGPVAHDAGLLVIGRFIGRHQLLTVEQLLARALQVTNAG